MITQNDHPRDVKHILGGIYAFFTRFGYWAGSGGRSPKGLVRKLLVQVFALDISKNGVFGPYFFCDIVNTQYHHPRDVKDVLGLIYVLFTLFR